VKNQLREEGMNDRLSAEVTLRKIRRKTRWRFSTEEKMRIVLEGLREDERIVDLCRREGINQNLYYLWRKELLESADIDLTQELKEKLLENEEIIALIREKGLLKDIFRYLKEE
jgi:transposase